MWARGCGLSLLSVLRFPHMQIKSHASAPYFASGIGYGAGYSNHVGPGYGNQGIVTTYYDGLIELATIPCVAMFLILGSRV